MSLMFTLVGIVFGVIAALIARSKGRNIFGWFVAGLFVGPFALISAVLPAKPREGMFLQCPACAEVIRTGATLCHHCGSAVPAG